MLENLIGLNIPKSEPVIPGNYGDPMHGGYLGAVMSHSGLTYLLIVSPKVEGSVSVYSGNPLTLYPLRLPCMMGGRMLN